VLATAYQMMEAPNEDEGMHLAYHYLKIGNTSENPKRKTIITMAAPCEYDRTAWYYRF
jgi:hypothetical protein